MTDRKRDRAGDKPRKPKRGARQDKAAGGDDEPKPKPDAWIDCGWGRLIFAQTFKDPAKLAETMRAEEQNSRDIAFYVHEPHVVLAAAPQELFLDPSHTFRLDLADYQPPDGPARGFSIRRLTSRDDADAANRIFAARGMVTIPRSYFWARRDSRSVTFFVAEEDASGDVIGVVLGLDHSRAFNDPERGSSLWCLAVDPQSRHAGVGQALIHRVAEHFKARGANYLDLSVLLANEDAMGLYEKLGFARVPVYAIKRKNPINENLFTGTDEGFDALNPYARIIVDEARRRGILVEVIDAEDGLFRLTWGGRSLRCRESLSELTTGVAMSICDNKATTRRIVKAAGLSVPDQIEATEDADLEAFIARHGSVVVKPARGEQGRGVAVGLTALAEVETAIAEAHTVSDDVLVEQCAPGSDLRLVVIDYEVVAAALRRPATIIGDGAATVKRLIERQNRRRLAATGGESRIPLDGETERCLAGAGYGYDDVPAADVEIQVRRTANLHTGGTIHDVTADVHPALKEAAVEAARAIGIPVVGIDFMVPDPSGPDYVFIEANERPGLANHEPQPTAARFVDLLYPLTLQQPAWTKATTS